MPLTPNERTLRARAAAFALHAKVDGRAITANARAAMRDKLLDQVDPERVLPPKERARRLLAAQRSHMALAQLAKARKARTQRETALRHELAQLEGAKAVGA
jgi:hypothetical protein